MKENERTMAVRMDAELYNRLAKVAEQDCCSVSAVVRRACVRYLDKVNDGE